MKIQVVGCHLQNLATFVERERILGKAIGGSPTGLDFYKDQFMFILGHKVNFAMAAAKVTFQDVMNPRVRCVGLQLDDESSCKPET